MTHIKPVDFHRARKPDETVQEFLTRVVHNLAYENCGILDQLMTVDAMLDYYGLFSVDYGTDFWEGVEECIADGDSEIPALEFVKRWNLGPHWIEAIQEAVDQRKTEES